MVCDGYVKYEEADVHRSAIMQDFRDNEEKQMADWRPFWTLLVQKLSWVIFVVRPYILLDIHRPAIFLFLVT